MGQNVALTYVLNTAAKQNIGSLLEEDIDKGGTKLGGIGQERTQWA